MNASRVPAAIYLASWMLTGAALSWWIATLWFRTEEQSPDLSIRVMRALVAMLMGAVVGLAIHAFLPHRPRTFGDVARMFQFSMRELVMLTALVATLLGWWLDKTVVRTRYEAAEKRIQNISGHISQMATERMAVETQLKEIGYRVDRTSREFKLVKSD